MDSPPVVFLIEDDLSVRRAIMRLLGSVGLEVEPFASAQEFLRQERRDGVSCLVLDVRLPGMSGLELQRALAADQILIPIIFITSHGDIRMTVQAMKGGAVEFLPKPFRDQELLDAIHIALEQDRVRRGHERQDRMLRERWESLTAREQEILPWIVSGLLTKQIASEIGTSETTVKVHRGQVIRKMGARSMPELVRMADRLKIPLPGTHKAS
jgi:FixJ family two-component response regulator